VARVAPGETVVPAVQVEIPGAATRMAPADAGQAAMPRMHASTSTVAAAMPTLPSQASTQAIEATPWFAPTQSAHGPATGRTPTGPSEDAAVGICRDSSNGPLRAQVAIMQAPLPVPGLPGPANPPQARAPSGEARPWASRQEISGSSRLAIMPTPKVQEKLAELARELATLRQSAKEPPAVPTRSPSAAGPGLHAMPATVGPRRFAPPPAATVWARHHLGHFGFRLGR
jgi:hypothetical protein